MTLKLLFALAVLALFLMLLQRLFLSFVSQRPADYAGEGPAFDPRVHLAGDILSEGMIYGPTGRVTSRFTARMRGDWGNAGGRLAEDFTFATGETLSREWSITQTGPDRFVATAPDVIGEATGEISGPTLRMRYRLKLTETAGGHVLNVTDWIYLAPNGVILNKSEMRKFGIKVAELVATMRPATP